MILTIKISTLKRVATLLKMTATQNTIMVLGSMLLLCFPLFCFGQDDPNLKEFDNRYEGETTEQISGSANLQVLSFVSDFQDFDWYQEQKLFIKFNLEDTKPVRILAQQTKGNIIYRMKPKEFTTTKGSNEFGPWPVDDVLSTLEMTRNKLGVIITDDSRTVFYPATIYHSPDSLNFQGYLVEFLPGKSLTKIKFSMYKGMFKDKEVNTDSLVYSNDFKDRTKHGGEPFQLLIDIADTDIDPDWHGWMTLTMSAKDYENYSNVQAIYFFYHSPDLNLGD